MAHFINCTLTKCVVLQNRFLVRICTCEGYRAFKLPAKAERTPYLCVRAHISSAAAATFSKMAVRFSEVVNVRAEEPSENVSDSDSSCSDFEELITSSDAAELSDEDDAEIMDLLFESAFTSSPSKYSTEDPCYRSSLLLLDKEFLEDEDLEGIGYYK